MSSGASPTITDALAGAQYATPVRKTTRSVLVVGAAGRLGERILARVVAAPEYQRVFVLPSDAMPSTEAKLTVLTREQWNFQIDDVIVIAGEETSDSAMPGRRRTAVFLSVLPDAMAELARRAKSSGTSRFMLVTPANVLAQPAAIYAQLANLMEVDLHQIGFESLLLLRPSDFEIRQRRRGIGLRLIGAVVDMASGLMVGLKHTPLGIEDAARAAVRALVDSGPGLTVLETRHLHQLLKS